MVGSTNGAAVEALDVCADAEGTAAVSAAPAMPALRLATRLRREIVLSEVIVDLFFAVGWRVHQDIVHSEILMFGHQARTKSCFARWAVDAVKETKRICHPTVATRLLDAFLHLILVMVVPLFSETEWKRRLNGLPAWQPDCAPTLVVVPHPDDETLAVGGVIAALRMMGADITIVAVTDGEHAYTENEGLAELRKKEQTRALEKLGVAEHKIVRLGLTDSGVATQEGDLVARLGTLISAETQVFAPWAGDFHPDHEACARAAASVAHNVGARLISYFFWTWHRGATASLDKLTLRSFPLDQRQQKSKSEALKCHSSQLAHDSGEPILPDSLLAPARRPFEVFCIS